MGRFEEVVVVVHVLEEVDPDLHQVHDLNQLGFWDRIQCDMQVVGKMGVQYLTPVLEFGVLLFFIGILKLVPNMHSIEVFHFIH